MRTNDLEIVVPYGNANGANHIRFAGDYLTFCGRNCEGWSKTDTTVGQAMNSAYTCKRCYAAAIK